MPRKSRSTTTLAAVAEPPSDPDAQPDTPVDVESLTGGDSVPQVRLEMVDPKLLRPNPHNPRISAEDVEDLVPSLRQVGVLQPLVVFPISGDGRHYTDRAPADTNVADADAGQVPLYEILIGHRRQVAAIEADLETVPCMVTLSEDVGEQIVKMLHENLERDGLTLQEEAAAYEQLSLLDWTPQRIAEQVTRPVERVHQALALQALPAQARTVAAQAAERGELDLEQVAALAEFADDPKAVERITARSGWGFRHAVAEEQAKRRRRDAAERLRAELTVQGVRLIPKPKYWGSNVFDGPETEASALVDRHGQPLDPETAKKLPGFAGFVDPGDSYQDPKVFIVCRDPEEWGYTRLSDALRNDPQRFERHDLNGSSSEGGGEVGVDAQEVLRRERAEAEQAAYIEQAERDRAAHQTRLAAYATATPVRQEFMVTTWGTARTAKKVFLDALRSVVVDLPEPYGDDDGAFFSRMAGADLHEATAAGIDRLTRMFVGWWVVQCEEALSKEIENSRWNREPAKALEHLDRLIAAGYELSDVEQYLHGRLTAELAPTNPDVTDQDDRADQHDGNPGGSDSPDVGPTVDPSGDSTSDTDTTADSDSEPVGAVSA